MGFFDGLSKAANILGSEMEKKQAEIEKRARREYREKARMASDDTLRRKLEEAEDNGNFILMDVIQDEMNRRGIY